MSERVFGCGDDSSKTAYALTGTYATRGNVCARMFWGTCSGTPRSGSASRNRRSVRLALNRRPLASAASRLA